VVVRGRLRYDPYYGFNQDCRHWHEIARQACAPGGDEIYWRFKQWCDDYFVIKHRNEQRGIGGLFFDDYNEHSFEHSFELMRAIGDGYLPAYSPIVDKRRDTPYGERGAGIPALPSWSLRGIQPGL